MLWSNQLQTAVTMCDVGRQARWTGPSPREPLEAVSMWTLDRVFLSRRQGENALVRPCMTILDPFVTMCTSDNAFKLRDATAAGGSRRLLHVAVRDLVVGHGLALPPLIRAGQAAHRLPLLPHIPPAAPKRAFKPLS